MNGCNCCYVHLCIPGFSLHCLIRRNKSFFVGWKDAFSNQIKVLPFFKYSGVPILWTYSSFKIRFKSQLFALNRITPRYDLTTYCALLSPARQQTLCTKSRQSIKSETSKSRQHCFYQPLSGMFRRWVEQHIIIVSLAYSL